MGGGNWGRDEVKEKTIAGETPFTAKTRDQEILMRFKGRERK